MRLPDFSRAASNIIAFCGVENSTWRFGNINLVCSFYPQLQTLEVFRILWLSCFSDGASKSTLNAATLKPLLLNYQEFYLGHFSGSTRLALTCRGLVILLPPGLNPAKVIKRCPRRCQSCPPSRRYSINSDSPSSPRQ